MSDKLSNALAVTEKFEQTYQRTLKNLSKLASSLVTDPFVVLTVESLPMFLTCNSGFRLPRVGVGLVGVSDVASSFTKRGFLAGWSFASTVSVDCSGFLIKGGLKGLKTMAA